MIGRLQILLPYSVTVPRSNLEPVDRVIDAQRVRIYPPYRSGVDPTAFELASNAPLLHINDDLGPLDPQPSTGAILLEGMESVLANALQVDFFGEPDRRQAAEDPIVGVGFRIANWLLGGLRALSRAGHVKAIDPMSTPWRLTYLANDGSELEPSEGVVRVRGTVAWRWKICGLPEDLWEAVLALPHDFEPAPWDRLLLDARDLLPDVGPAVVLAFTAIETRLENVLNDLASAQGVNSALWEWIMERDGDRRAQPSLVEQADVLMEWVGGTSLKNEASLWEAFQNLRSARNGFVHGGQARLGDQEMSESEATQLITKASKILDWLESQIPESERRPRWSREADPGVLRITRMLTEPVIDPA